MSKLKNNYNKYKSLLNDIYGKVTLSVFLGEFWILLKCFFRYGLRKFLRKYIKECNDRAWFNKNVPSIDDIVSEEKTFSNKPKISIVLVATKKYYNKIFFSIDSVLNQTYTNIELLVVDTVSSRAENIQNTYGDKIVYMLKRGISYAEALDTAISTTTGDYIAILEIGDILPTYAIHTVVSNINKNNDVDLIYTDEDKFRKNLVYRFDPYFKPCMAIDTLRSTNYINHMVIFRKNFLIDTIGSVSKDIMGAEIYDLVLRSVEKTSKISHISRVLYHHRVRHYPMSRYQSEMNAVRRHIDRCGLRAEVRLGNAPGVYNVQYLFEGNPKVNILIPNKDCINYLKDCIETILEMSTYDNFEIDIIENNSTEPSTFAYYDIISKDPRVKILHYNEKGFNYSKIINFGVKSVDGEYVIQLNNDTKIMTPNWLERMIGFASRKDVGIVGAKLYYEDMSIQHAGIYYNYDINTVAGNLLTTHHDSSIFYHNVDCVIQNLSGVTGACLFSRRDLYEKLGYMDEENFAVAYNDVDFCMKARVLGYLVVFDPYTELIHYESKSRGYDALDQIKQARLSRESSSLFEKWKDVLKLHDPYYNDNLIVDGAYSIKNYKDQDIDAVILEKEDKKSDKNK